MSPKDARRAVGWSLAKAAVMADVSEPTARLYEVDPSAVATPEKRHSLDRVYGELAKIAEQRRAPAG